MVSISPAVIPYLRSRLSSRSFHVPFAISTALFVVNLVLVTIARDNFVLLNPIYGYGAMTGIYLVCMLESLGFSIFYKAIYALGSKIASNFTEQ